MTAVLDAPSHFAPDTLSNGFRVGAYVVAEQIGEGGGGAVYEAKDAFLGRRVALKVLHRELVESKEMVERFLLEARTVNKIGHPNIVDIVEFGHLSDGRPFYVMELLAGRPVSALVHARRNLTVSELLEILEPVCLALQAAHDLGVVHRDLTPKNVMVADGPGRPIVKLLDFGIAKLTQPEPGFVGLTAIGRKIGTPVAMSPEQIRGRDVTQLADIYALGVFIYFCLTGTFPFDGATSSEVFELHLNAPPPAPSRVVAVSRAVDAIVQRCLAKEASDRFRTPTDVLAALRATLAKAASPSHEGSSSLAVAVYVEVETALDGSDVDEELAALQDAAALLDTCRAELDVAGFSFAPSGANALLALDLLDDTDAPARVAGAVSRAETIARAVAERAERHPANRAAIAVHVDAVVARHDGSGKPTFTGPVMHVHAWASTLDAPAVNVSTRARDAARGGRSSTK